MEINIQQPPDGWVNVKLGEISEIKYGKGLPIKQLKDSGYPVFGANGVIGYYDEFSYEDEQLLISCRGANSGTINFSPRNCFVTNNSLIIDFCTEPVQLRKILFYFLQTANKERLVTGTAQPQVTINNAVELDLSLPPLNEQYRIVAKIEELFSELDKGIENLKTAQAQLKVYRQALLKHAFEGKLTAQWRAENRDKLESADALLKRIQQERTQRYLQQLAEWEASGKQGSKPKAPNPLPPLTAEELTELPELPEGWGWVKLGQAFNVYVGSTPSRKRADFWNGDISWVSSGEVAFCRIKETKEKITNIGYENASTEIHPIGTVMLAMIGEGKTRGQAAILDIEASHNQNTAAIRVSESGCSSSFVYQYLVYQYEVTRKIGSGNNQKALNKERVSDLIFPLCSIAEMDEVVRCTDEKLSIADQLDQTIATALQQAEALRQAILKKAFSGQLVPQDPNDEPASELLARIKAGKGRAIKQ